MFLIFPILPFGIKFLKPWLVDIASSLIATSPIGARDVNKTDFSGSTFAEDFSSPNFVS